LRYFTQCLLVLTLFVSCASTALAQNGAQRPGEIVTARPWPEYSPESWKEFSSKEGRFTILFPGVPQENTHQFDSVYGKLAETSFILKTFAYYGVAFSDFPEKNGITDVKAFFNGFRVGNLKSTQAQLLEEKDDDSFASPGRFIKTRLGGGYINQIRLHLVKNRLYVLSVVMPEEAANAETRKFYEDTALKFLNSFKPSMDQSYISGKPFGDPVVSSAPSLSRDGKPLPEVRVEGGILNGKALSLPPPDYPAEAKAAGASGEVMVRIVFDESGDVIWAKATSGPALLQAAAEEAAAKAKFAPTKLKGVPVKVSGSILYRFVSK
jgi:TonB family protein